MWCRGGVVRSAQIKLLDLREPVMGCYNVEYTDADNRQFILNERPQHPALDLPLEQAYERAYEQAQSSFVSLGQLIQPGERKIIPGTFGVRQYDFTLTDYVEYEPITADFGAAPSSFKILANTPAAGGTLELRLEGNLDGLAQPPRWDFYTDFVDDAFGPTATLPLPYPGAYKISVTLQEKSGATTRIERWYNATAAVVPGYYAVSATCTPVVQAVGTLPDEAELLAQTTECVADPLPYGYSTGSLGPWWVIYPPEEFANTPLKSLELVMYISPLSGDTDPHSPIAGLGSPSTPHIAVYLAPQVYAVNPIEQWVAQQPLFCTQQFIHTMDGFTTQERTGVTDFTYSNISSEIRDSILGGLDEPSLRDDFAQYLSELRTLEHPDACRLWAYRNGPGLDIDALPSTSAEVAVKLKAFYDSPLYSVRYAKLPQQETTWLVDLHAGQLQTGQGLMVGINLETRGWLSNAQYILHSGASYPSRVILTPVTGEPYTSYIDFGIINRATTLPGVPPAAAAK